MGRIAELFAGDFAHWRLQLPAEALQARQPGHIQDQGWLIQYAFGRNRRGEFLDYYAAHRMSDDCHVRLYASGRREHLSALASAYLTSPHPEEARRLRAAYVRRNRRVARHLVAKGFDKFTINMALHAGLEE